MKKLLSLALSAMMLLQAGVLTAFAEGEPDPSVVSNEDQLIEAIANNESIRLDKNIQLKKSLEVESGSLTIDLDGHTLKTADVSNSTSPLVTAAAVFELKGDADLTVTGPGTIQAGDTIDSKGTGAAETITLNGESKLTLDGVEVKGSYGINSRFSGTAIEIATGSAGELNVVNGSSILGGDMMKDGDVYHEDTSYSNQGDAGVALNLYGGTITVEDSTVKGGSGLYQNFDTAYTNRGINFAESAQAISMGNGEPSVTVRGCTVAAGDSQLYNAEDAISVITGTLSLEDSSVTGGSCTVKNDYGIAGSAIDVGYGSPTITVDSSTLTAGATDDSFLGCAVSLTRNAKLASMSISNSILTGGAGEGPVSSNNGAAVNVASTDVIASPDKLSIENSLLKVYAKVDALCITGMELADALKAVMPEGSSYEILDNGDVQIGDAPTPAPNPDDSSAEIDATVDPSFTITIPSKVSFGSLKKNTGIEKKNFSVAATDVSLEDGMAVSVNLKSNNTLALKDKEGEGKNSIPFSLFNAKNESIKAGRTYCTFTEDGVNTGSLQLDTADIQKAGNYKGSMVFQVKCVAE